MAVYGYNPTEVQQLGPVIKNVVSEVTTTIRDNIQNNLVVPMSDYWYAKEAQQFFEALAIDLLAYKQSIIEAFNIFEANIDVITKNWAERTGNEIVTLDRISEGDIGSSLQLDVSVILDNKAGVSGIDEAGARSVSTRLTSIQQEITQSLTSISSRLNASSAFIGGNQDQAISECFGKVGAAVARLFDNLTVGENSLKANIDKFIAQYTNTATNIVNELSNVQ